MNRRLLFAGLLGALVTPLTAASLTGFSLLGGCVEGQYPVCHTDGDCQQRDAGPHSRACVNLRCVECRHDADCAAGSICTGTGTCDALDHHRAVESDAGSVETKSWDPMNWNECAAGCKDQDCVAGCDRRFHAK
jgi:hypothetical protein